MKATKKTGEVRRAARLNRKLRTLAALRGAQGWLHTFKRFDRYDEAVARHDAICRQRGGRAGIIDAWRYLNELARQGLIPLFWRRFRFSAP